MRFNRQKQQPHITKYPLYNTFKCINQYREVARDVRGVLFDVKWQRYQCWAVKEKQKKKPSRVSQRCIQVNHTAIVDLHPNRATDKVRQNLFTFNNNFGRRFCWNAYCESENVSIKMITIILKKSSLKCIICWVWMHCSISSSKTFAKFVDGRKRDWKSTRASAMASEMKIQKKSATSWR